LNDPPKISKKKIPEKSGGVNKKNSLAYPQFLRKEPMAEKNPEERGGSPWGSG